MIRKNVVGVLVVMAFVLTIAIRWMGISGQNYQSVISSDGKGYYHYYVSAFDSSGFANQKANGTYLVYTPKRKVVNKYFVGLPLLWSPFVLPVYVYYSIASSTHVDLFAEGFQKAISLAALFYLFLGLLALKKLLQSFNFEDRVVNFSLFAFFIGTNLSYYTIIAPSMSHVYSFALIVGFLLFVRLFSIKQLPQYFIYAALIFAMIVLVRPINGLVLFAIPIVWKRGVSFFGSVNSKVELLIVSAFLGIMIVVIQPIFWFLQTGSWIQWSYAGEGFYFSTPHILDFLISYRKGVFVYSPLILVSMFGLIPLFRKQRSRFWFYFGFISILVYFFSSWWNWYYGDSYGSRVMIDFYSIFVLLFAVVLQKSSQIIKGIVLTVSILLIFLNVFQSYQYYHNIMSHFDMNGEKYWYIFGKSGEEYENRLGGNDDIAPYHKKAMETIFVIEKNESSLSYRVSCSTSLKSESEKQLISTVVDGQQFPCTISFAAPKLMEYKALYAEMQCATFNEDVELNDVYWTVGIRSEHTPSHYYAFRINDTPKRKEGFREDTYRFALPMPQNINDEVLISLWNKGQKRFQISALKIEVFGIKE